MPDGVGLRRNVGAQPEERALAGVSRALAGVSRALAGVSRAHPARGRRWRRPAKAIVVAAALAMAVVLLGGCSNAGIGLAREACNHVDVSIRAFIAAEHDTNVAKQRRQLLEATVQLEAAEPIAARANSADPAFNPLMTTLQELGRTTEANLIPALRAQCAAAASSTGGVGGAPTGPTAPTGATRTSATKTTATGPTPTTTLPPATTTTAP